MCLNPLRDLARNVKLPQPLTCDKSAVPWNALCNLCTWCYADVRLMAVLLSPGKAWVEGKGNCPFQPFSLPLFPHPPGGLLHLSGVRWTWGAKVRPLRKKECAFLNRVDKCVWALETDLSYMTLQFVFFGKIPLLPLCSKMSEDTAVQEGVASSWALQRHVSITSVLMVCAEDQALIQSSMNQ